MPGLLGGNGFLGFGGQQQQPVQQQPDLRDQIDRQRLENLTNPPPPEAPGFEGKTPAGSRPRILVDIATRFAAGEPLTTQDAQRYNIAHAVAGQPTQSFRNGVLITEPGLSPEALARLPTTEQIFARVGQGGQQQAPLGNVDIMNIPPPATGGFSTLDFLPGQQGAPAATAPPTPLGAQPQPAPPPPQVQPQGIPQGAPQQPAPQAAPAQFNGSGQSIADAPVEIVQGLPGPRMIPFAGVPGASREDPAFSEQRKLEIQGIAKRGTELEDTRQALGSVRQLFALSKNTPTGSMESLTLPFRNLFAGLPDGFDFGLIDRNKLARQQMFDALQTRMVPINRAGTPGQVSNIEFQAYKTASSSLGNLPYANMILSGGLLQLRTRTEALQTYVAKAVQANPGLTQTQAARDFERKVEDQLRNHPSGGFIVDEKGGTTIPMINAKMVNGDMQAFTGGSAAYASLPPDTLFRDADGIVYMKGNKHTDPFDTGFLGER